MHPSVPAPKTHFLIGISPSNKGMVGLGKNEILVTQRVIGTAQSPLSVM